MKVRDVEEELFRVKVSTESKELGLRELCHSPGQSGSEPLKTLLDLSPEVLAILPVGLLIQDLLED